MDTYISKELFEKAVVILREQLGFEEPQELTPAKALDCSGM